MFFLLTFLDFYRWFQGQGMFLSLALVPGSRCVSLVLVSGPKCVLFTGSGFRSRLCFFH